MNTSPKPTEVLEPCPFCGGDTAHCYEPPYGAFAVICEMCGAEGSIGATNDAAIAAWNRRTTLRQHAELVERVRVMEVDAKWGAHNGGAHQLIKLHHADAMKLYAALKQVRPNHPLIDEYRQAYCEIARSSKEGQCATEGPRP